MEQNAKNCIQGLDQALLMKTKMAELAYSAQNYYRFSICTFCKSCICRKLQDWSFRCGGKKCLFVFFCEMGFFVFFSGIAVDNVGLGRHRTLLTLATGTEGQRTGRKPSTQ